MHSCTFHISVSLGKHLTTISPLGTGQMLTIAVSCIGIAGVLATENGLRSSVAVFITAKVF